MKVIHGFSLNLHTGQTLTSSFISSPTQKKIKVKTSSRAKVIQPAVEIRLSITGR